VRGRSGRRDLGRTSPDGQGSSLVGAAIPPRALRRMGVGKWSELYASRGEMHGLAD
jgi:hypothetical protein